MQDSKNKPLFKKRMKDETKNNRSISIFPLISNVIEKSIQHKSQDYLQKNELF